jgi:hypothetical protein
MTDTALYSSIIESSTEKLKDIKAAIRVNKSSEDPASFHMLSLARANLGVRLRAIDETSLVSQTQKNIYAAVADMLKAPTERSTATGTPEWDEIYKAESLIALLYGGEQLRQEIDSRLRELASADLAKSDILRREYQELLKRPVDGSNSGAEDSTLRLFLLRVLESVHCNAKEKLLAGPIRLQATNRILKCLSLSFFLLIIPNLLINFDSTSAPSKFWSLFALYTALSAGLLGAFTSRLKDIQRQWANMSLNEVFLQREWSHTFLRAGVGVCGALIVYVFLQSGIAEGALFPKFEEISMVFVEPAVKTGASFTFVMPSKALALLTFWCFLAGFSETLVSTILRNTEQKLTDAASPTQAVRN